jgi:DedD protein
VERHVKERLIGAAVLLAAAIILIPEMLSGSDPERAAEATPANGGAPLKTYTIDLSKSPSTQAAAATPEPVDNRAPPPEAVAAADLATPPQASPESENAQTASAAAAPVDTAPLKEETPPSETPPPNPAPRVAQTPPQAKSSNPAPRVAEPVATPAPAPTKPAAASGGGWAVQMGSFASRATADRLVKELRGDGQDAFVMPVKSGGSTLYRVRVGPMQDRESAQQALAKLKAKVPGAAIVPHP